MMYQGFAGEYEAPSSRCSSASPAGDSLTYYPSPADSFSSMGSPVNSQVRAVARPPRGSVLGVPGRRWARGGGGARIGPGRGGAGPEGRGRLQPGRGQRGERPRRRRGAGGGSRGPGCALRRVCKAASLIKREFIEETPERRLRQRGRQRYLYRAALVRSGAGGAAPGAAGSGPEGSADRSPPLTTSPPTLCPAGFLHRPGRVQRQLRAHRDGHLHQSRPAVAGAAHPHLLGRPLPEPRAPLRRSGARPSRRLFPPRRVEGAGRPRAEHRTKGQSRAGERGWGEEGGRGGGGWRGGSGAGARGGAGV